MSKRKSSASNIRVFHGAKHWSSATIVRARSIEYMIGRGWSLNDAINYAKGQLVYLNDFNNRSVLDRVMLSAQTSGAFSPFVSTSRRREIARSFALSSGTPGFILTIEGPENAFYDFNKIRDTYGIPHPTEFKWLEELGIPLRIDAPLSIVQVEQVTDLVEVKTRVYPKHGRRKK